LEYAENTFALLQVYAADNLNGGYYENLERDWAKAAGGVYAGDRKSLDIHMHLMEAFTVLYQASRKDIHRRKLIEVIGVICGRMVNSEGGYGLNQFDAGFSSLPAINIYRTWNFDREKGETLGEPADTTSYGHNLELGWLLKRACDTLGTDGEQWGLETLIKKLIDHSLLYGYDHEFGGVYRDGIGCAPAVVKDKEWWQNFEAMAGYLNGYEIFGDARYVDASYSTWEFVKKYFVIPELGESRQLLDRTGTPIISGAGNLWKGIYHTGRSLFECICRIENMGV
jgi:mannobiose 2-epimerase